MATSRFYRSALSTEPVSVNIGRYRFTLEEALADRWILAITDEDIVTEILPGLLPEGETDRFYDLLTSDRVGRNDLDRAVRDAINTASGMKWWEAQALIFMAEHGDGEFYGRLLLRGIDATRMTLGAWCAACLALALEGQDDKTRLKFTTRLKAPPAGVGDEDMEDEGMSFESMVRMAQSTPGMSVGR